MSAGVVVCGPPDAPAVLLIHGLGGSPRVWDRVVPLINASVRVYAAHLDPTTSIENDADAVAALVDAPTLIVGHSRGGLVATAVAERHPELVAELVLLCTPWSPASRLGSKQPAERALAIPIIGDLLWALAPKSRQRAGLRSAFAPGTFIPDQFVADVRARGRRSLTRSSRAIDDYLASRALPDRLSDITAPIELIFGERDARVALPRDEFASAASATLTVLPGVGHTPPWESPERIADLVIGSLPRIEAPGFRT
jgi:pimeloyl-ACP methyl ester carboxylesterase